MHFIWRVIRGPVAWLALRELARIAHARRRRELGNPLGWRAPATDEGRERYLHCPLHLEPVTRASGLPNRFTGAQGEKMGNQTVYAGIALGCMAAAIVAGGFAPVTPGDIAPYCKAGAAVFTGLAALFMHPPGWQSDAVAAAPASTAEKSNAAH